MNAKAQKRIDHCRATQAPILNLSNCELTELPAEIFELKHLRSLAAANNQLTEIPAAIGELILLESIHFARNQLTELPESISKLGLLSEAFLTDNQLEKLPSNMPVSLKAILLTHNHLTDLGTAIKGCTQLERLYLEENELAQLDANKSLPASLIDLHLSKNQLTAFDNFQHLQALRKLDLSNNLLPHWKNPPDTFPQLENLYLGQNQISTLEGGWKMFPKLEALHLSSNQLTSFHFDPDFGQNLRVIFLVGNKISRFTGNIGKRPGLHGVELSQNELKKLEVSFTGAVNLSSFSLRHNQLVSFDCAMLSPNTKAIDLSSNQLETFYNPGMLFHLTSLNLEDNQLREIPEDLALCADLASLNYDKNKLEVIPQIFQHFPRLTALRLNRNWLRELPDLSICKHITELHLAHNQLIKVPKLPKKLTQLVLSNNRLSSLPDSLATLGELIQLWVDRNSRLKQWPEKWSRRMYILTAQETAIPPLQRLNPTQDPGQIPLGSHPMLEVPPLRPTLLRISIGEPPEKRTIELDYERFRYLENDAIAYKDTWHNIYSISTNSNNILEIQASGNHQLALPLAGFEVSPEEIGQQIERYWQNHSLRWYYNDMDSLEMEDLDI